MVRFGFKAPLLSKRIAAKVDELMAICDQLEKQLESQHKESRRSVEALLHKAWEGVG